MGKQVSDHVIWVYEKDFSVGYVVVDSTRLSLTLSRLLTSLTFTVLSLVVTYPIRAVVSFLLLSRHSCGIIRMYDMMSI